MFQKSTCYRLNIALDLIETNITSRKQDLNQLKDHLYDHHCNSFFHENIDFNNFENMDFYKIRVVGNEILVNKSLKQFFMEEIDLIKW